MIVYVLTNNEVNEGGAVAGVYSTEDIARKEAAKKPARAPFYWAIVPRQSGGRT